jgi:hypothetical protein
MFYGMGRCSVVSKPHRSRRSSITWAAPVRADPGRQGMSRRLLAWLAGCGARRLVYVSCNPATMVCPTLDQTAAATLCCASTCAAAEKPLQREQHDDPDGPVVFVLQARDLAFLLGNAADSVQPARFQLEYVQACDMFPQTRYVLAIASSACVSRSPDVVKGCADAAWCAVDALTRRCMLSCSHVEVMAVLSCVPQP